VNELVDQGYRVEGSDGKPMDRAAARPEYRAAAHNP
jgi:hypothetical protein